MTERERIVKSLRACSDHMCDECPWFAKCGRDETVNERCIPPDNLIHAAIRILEKDGITLEGIETVLSGKVHRFAGEGFQVIPKDSI